VTYWENIGIPMKDARGKVVAAIEISCDVTDRIHVGHEIQNLSEHMDSQIKQYKEEMAKRLDFIHKLSGDVRGDIEDMSDQLSFLHHRPEFKNAEWITPMMELNEKTLRRVGNLGDLFSMEESPIQLVYVPFEVTELVDEIYNRFKHRAKEKNIGLEVHLARTMPKKLIGDVFRMNAILMNILENSLTHTQNGSIKVYFYGLGKTEEGFAQIQIVVSDTGMGLTEERLNKIQALLKEDGSRHYLDQAMAMQGLGLLMAHNTLKAMDGYLELESQFGRGTQVKLNFTMGHRTEKQELKHREMVHEEESAENEIRQSDRKLILIAEDEVVGRVTYKIQLQDHFDLVFAKNGKEAVELYLAEKPDLVFMDIMMPVLNGLEAFDEIEKYRRRQVPIIACTAKVIDSEREYLLTYGFSDYLPKPVEAGNLMRLVTKYLK
jgi:CheY-like chemotaxis protein